MGGEGFGRHDLSLSLKTLELAFEYGVRYFDTAGFYANGRSEALIKKTFGRVRKEIFISTKGGLKRKGRRVWHDARPESLKEDLFQSLDRLNTDYIDLFNLHWPDPKVPLNESIDAIKDLKKQGLIRYIGVCNLSVEQIENFIMPEEKIFHQVHFNPIHCSSLSILKSGKNRDRCINCIISPFEQGLLVNPLYLNRRFGKKDIRNRNPYFKDRDIKERLRRFFLWCNEQRVNPVHVVINWILRHKEVDIIIFGPKTPSQLFDILDYFKDFRRDLDECFFKDNYN